MRLHFNKKLRAALIAAISTVATTLPLAQAEVSWDGGPKDSHGYTQVFYLNNGKTASLTDTDHNQFLITSNVNGANPATGEITSVVTKDGALMRISGGNNWGDDRILNPLTIDNVQAGGGTGTVNISTQPWNASRPAANTTVSILAVSGTVGSVENYGVLTLGASGSTINAAGTLVNHEGATLTLNGSYSFDTSNATKYTLKQEGSATWTDVTNQQGFKKTTGSSYYIIKGATAGTGFQATTTTGATVSEESTGTYYFTAGDVTDTTKFYVKTDAVTLEDVTGTGVFQVDHAGATVTVQNATYRVTTGNMNVNIVINDKGVLETTHSGVNGFITGALTINAGGIMRIVGEHDAFGWGSKNQCVASLVMEGTSEKEARLELNQSTGNSATMVTDITMKGYSTITSSKQGGSAGFNTFGCAITAENVQNTIDVLDTRRNGVTITVADGGELTVKKQTINGSDNSAATVVVKQGAGTLFYTGEAKAKDLNIQAGTVDFSGTAELQALTIGVDGSMKVSGGTTTVGGAANVLSNTITVSGGSLILNGTYEIGGNTGEMTTTYVGGETEGVNGFEHIAGSSTVYTKGDGATVNVEGATFTIGGQEVELENGVYTTEGSTNYGTFYVKSGAESLDKALTYAGAHTVSTVSLANDTTINADHAGATIGIALQGSATVNATEATTISSISDWRGNTLTVAGTATVSTPGALFLDEAGDALTVEEGVTLAITGSNNLTVLHGEATINGTLTIGHEIDLSKGSASDGKITIGSTGSVTAKDGMWMNHTAVGVLLEEGGTLTITGKGVKFTGKTNGSIKVAAGKEMNYNVGNTDAIITNATMEALDNMTIANQLVDVDVVTGAHTVSLNSTADTVSVSAGGTINFGTSGAANAISVQDGGIIGTYAKTGEGDTAITSAGTAVLNSVIALQGGTLTMSGNYNIDALDGEITVTDYVDGAVKGNGFAVESGTITVVNVAPEAQLDTTDGVFLRGGSQATMEGGVARVDTTNRSKFYVNIETENLTTAQAISPDAAVVLADGAKLVADANLTAGLSVAEGGHAYLQIEEGKLVQATVDAAVELSGSGTYALVSGVSTMGSTTLGEDWTGAIRLGGFSFSNTSLASFWREGSVVEMCGITGGYLEGWNNGDPVAANIRLTNPAEGNDGIAWKWNEGTTGNTEPTITFTGDWDGSGTFQLTYRRQNVTFAGDISGWEGVFDYAGTHGTRLTFKADADEINATILNNGTNNPENVQQQFHIIVENAATFNKSVSAYTLEVANGASATFNAAVAITTSITVGEDATLNMTAGGSIAEAIVSAGTVSLTGVTLSDDFVADYDGFAHYDVDGNLAPELANYYGGTDGKYLTVVTGTGAANATGSGLVWGTQDNLAMDKGLVKVEDGGVIDYSAFYVTESTTTNDILTYAGEHAQKLEWIVVDSGTLTLSEPLTDIYLMVSSNAAIAGAVTQEQMEGTLIGQGATATFEGVTELAPGTGNDHVSITSADSQTVAITNIGETDEIITYEGLAQDSAKVTADAVVVEAEREADVTIANALEVQSITNNSEHTLYLDGEVVTEALDAAAGDITLRNVAESVEVGSLTIGDHVAVGAYQGTEEEAAQEATVVISQTLTAGEESVLHANLELKDGATLNFDGTLTMTSTLGVEGLLTLDEDSALYQELASFAEGSGRWVDLIMAGDGSNLVYTHPEISGADAASVFTNSLFGSGDYMIFATEKAFGITRVPEPTTGTLSLLALMALAARRRRH